MDISIKGTVFGILTVAVVLYVIWWGASAQGLPQVGWAAFAVATLIVILFFIFIFLKLILSKN